LCTSTPSYRATKSSCCRRPHFDSIGPGYESFRTSRRRS
jgi:hypothetical protein